MNIAEWIIAGILSFTLFIFLIFGIIALAKVHKLTDEATEIIKKSGHVVDNANGIVTNVKNFSNVSNIIRTVSDVIIENREHKAETEAKSQKEAESASESAEKPKSTDKKSEK